MKILIGYDGSNSSEMTVRDLKEAGIPYRAEIVVLSTADMLVPPPPSVSSSALEMIPSIQQARERGQKSLRIAQSLAQSGAAKIKKIFPRAHVVATASIDTPSWALVKKAESWKADLIVVGAHGHSRIGRFMGSVSQMVAINAPCSVRVARAPERASRVPLRIVIGLDGSAGADATIEAVSKRVWPVNTNVLIVTAMNPKKPDFSSFLMPTALRWFLEQDDDERSAIRRMQEEYARKLREKRLVVTCLVKKGDPRRVLVQEAAAWKAGCIFLGARGLGGVNRFLIGGVSSAVAAGANCSVEIVRQ